MPPGTNLKAAMAAAVKHLSAKRRAAETEDVRYSYVFVQRDGERAMLSITAQHPYAEPYTYPADGRNSPAL